MMRYWHSQILLERTFVFSMTYWLELIRNQARKKACSVAGLSITSHHKPLRAFAVAACPADRAAPFVLDRSAALGAGPLFQGRRMQLGHPAVFVHAGLDRLGDGVGAGKDLAFA